MHVTRNITESGVSKTSYHSFSTFKPKMTSAKEVCDLETFRPQLQLQETDNTHQIETKILLNKVAI